MLVGDKEISNEYLQYPKLIIVRDLKYNIEQENRLLTFTAWYAISKNNLFPEYQNICILEYDVIILQNFENILSEAITYNVNTKIFSFVNADISDFYKSFDFNVANAYLTNKNIDNNIINYIEQLPYWYATTNYCIHRDIINDFVDWYYPSCLDIKNVDYNNISFYHERLFFIYLVYNGINCQYITGILHHLFSNSHGYY